jgi:hypothetical protein
MIRISDEWMEANVPQVRGKCKCLWVLAVVDFKRDNPVVPGNKSATGLALVWAETDREAVQQASQWAAQHNGTVARIIETGSCATELPVSEKILNIHKAIEQVAATREPAFLVLLSGTRPLYSELHAKAVSFLRAWRLPVNPLSEAETQSLRARWRRKYLPARIHPRRHHQCEGCGSGNSRVFDWDSLECAEPMPPLSELLTDDQELIGLWFERCDLPAFVCQAHHLHKLEPGSINTDLYITPLKDLRWTIVCTHEQPLCGPYFCRGEKRIP